MSAIAAMELCSIFYLCITQPPHFFYFSHVLPIPHFLKFLGMYYPAPKNDFISKTKKVGSQEFFLRVLWFFFFKNLEKSPQ